MSEDSAFFDLAEDDQILENYNEILHRHYNKSKKEINDSLNILKEVRSLLLIDFGPGGKHTPDIIDRDLDTYQMAFRVLRYLGVH